MGKRNNFSFNRLNLTAWLMPWL